VRDQVIPGEHFDLHLRHKFCRILQGHEKLLYSTSGVRIL
jgi:hypothetical protein